MATRAKSMAGAVKRAVPALLAAALLAVVPGARLAASDWPMLRGNEARTGFAPEQAAVPLAQAWVFPAGAEILSSPVVSEGVVYFGARDGGVYALDAATGVRLWRFQASNWVDSSPAVYGSRVYAVSADGWLYALDKNSGALAWRQALGAPSSCSPLVYDGKVYAGAGLPEKKLKVFDAASGAQLGAFQAGQPVDSAPAAYGGRVYFGANDGYIYSLDPATLLPPAGWSHYQTAGSFRLNTVAAAGGAVYALPGHDDKKLYALDAATGGELRKSAQVEAAATWQIFTSPVLAGDRVYFAGAIGAVDEFTPAGGNYMSSLDTGTLTSVWASSPSLGGLSNQGLLSSPAMAGGTVFAGTAGGRLVAVSTAGAVLQSLALSSAAYSSPAVANGRVYIGTMGGDLYAFSAAKAASFSAPAQGDVVYGPVGLRGYAVNPAMSGYELSYSTGGAPEVWHAVSSVVTAGPVEDAELGSWDVTDLPNGLYTLKLSVLEGGLPVPANTALLSLRVNAPSGAPSALAATDVPGDGGNSVALNWSTAAVTAGAALRVYRAAPDSDPALLASLAAGTTWHIDAAAVTGATYTYTVRAFDGYSESEDSNQAEAFSVNNTGDAVPPAAVADLSAAQGQAGGSLLLAWTAPGNDGLFGAAARYHVRCSTSAGYAWAAFDGPSLSTATLAVEGPAGDNQVYEFGGLDGGATYYCAVKTADFVPLLSPLSNIATAWATVDPVPPAPPAALAAVDAPGDDGGRIDLSWTASPDDVAGARDVRGYRIYRRLQGGVFVASAPYARVPAGTAAYRDEAATENVRFYYAVAAYDSSNASALSGEASAISADNYRFVDATQGSSVRLADGARVDIPGNAVNWNDGIMFTRLDPATYQPLAGVLAAGRANPTDVVYEVKFRTAGTKLTGRARVTLPYTDADVAGMEQENLRLYTLSGGAWAMLNTSSVDVAARKVSADVSHFSVFRIMEYLPSGQLFSPDEVYTYPNPATGDTVTFKFMLSAKAFVRVDVYNVAGEKIASMEKADCPAGQASELAWGVKGVASGVYVYRVRAESAAGSRTVVKKLAVIH